MTLNIGIDVGGTFTDFVVTRAGAEPAIYKTLSTPQDPKPRPALALNMPRMESDLTPIRVPRLKRSRRPLPVCSPGDHADERPSEERPAAARAAGR